MTHNHWTRALLVDELGCRTRLSEETMELIARSFLERLEERRYAIVPTYLTDEMYDAQKNIDHGLEYKRANELFASAIRAHVTQYVPPVNDDDQPGFW